MKQKILDLIIAAKRTDPETGSFDEWLAEYLVANGVTVQEWIPVGERLPEESSYYLYAANSPYRGLKDGVGVSYYMHKSKKWSKTNGDYVTHWMPLPKPPGKDGA